MKPIAFVAIFLSKVSFAQNGCDETTCASELAAYEDAYKECSGSVTSAPTSSLAMSFDICDVTSAWESRSMQDCLNAGWRLFLDGVDETACENGPSLYAEYIRCSYSCQCGASVCSATEAPTSSSAPVTVYSALRSENLLTFADLVDKTGYASMLQDTEESFTLFAPTDAALDKIGGLYRLSYDDTVDLVLHHIATPEYQSSEFTTGGSIRNKNNWLLTTTLDPLRVDGVDVTLTDIPASNGIVHVVDEVMIPSTVDGVTQAPASSCVDSETWHKKNKPHQDCSWVTDFAVNRCRRTDANGVSAADACVFSCGTCSRDDCQNDPDWFVKGQPDKDCEWIAESSGNRCRRFATGKVYAWQACPAACKTCSSVLPACTASSTSWFKKGDPSKDCDWLAAKPDTRCKAKGEDGSWGYEGCPTACGACA